MNFEDLKKLKEETEFEKREARADYYFERNLSDLIDGEIDGTDQTLNISGWLGTLRVQAGRKTI